MFQYAEHTVAGLSDVNQDIPGEEVTLLSGWLSVLRRTVREQRVTTSPSLPLFVVTGGSCSTYAAI